MLNVFLSVYDQIGCVINSNFTVNLLDIDRNLLEELCSYPKVFDQVINQLSDEKHPTNAQGSPSS